MWSILRGWSDGARYWAPARLHHARMRVALEWQWQWRHARRPAKGAELPGGLVVSLTSYPPRFATLDLTLKSLLLQSLRPDHLQLWIAHDDLAALPAAVRALTRHGVAIHGCADWKSYKKLVPALMRDSRATIVTADDDTYYWPDWLQQLVAARVPGRAEVLCHRMHRINVNAAGLPLAYGHWSLDSAASDANGLHFPTGVGGILYPPGIFAATVADVAAFTALCPSGDDIWFYWMARLNGAVCRRVPGAQPVYCWRGSQDVALWKNNLEAEWNDRQIAAMIGRYGFVGTH